MFYVEQSIAPRPDCRASLARYTHHLYPSLLLYSTCQHTPGGGGLDFDPPRHEAIGQEGSFKKFLKGGLLECRPILIFKKLVLKGAYSLKVVFAAYYSRGGYTCLAHADKWA